MANRWKSPRLLAIVVVALVALSADAGDVASDMTKAGKSVAKAATKFGHQVAESGKKVGLSVAEAAEEGGKQAWYTTRNWTTRESKQVADATVRWWDDAIRGKEATRDRLRRENESLKRKAREQEKGD